MSAIDVIRECKRIGVELRANGDRIQFRPVDLVTPKLRDKLRAHKPMVLAILREHGREAPENGNGNTIPGIPGNTGVSLTLTPLAAWLPAGEPYYTDIDGRLYPCGPLPMTPDYVVVHRRDARGRERLVRLPVYGRKGTQHE